MSRIDTVLQRIIRKLGLYKHGAENLQILFIIIYLFDSDQKDRYSLEHGYRALAQPLYEIYGLAVRAFAARRLDVCHRRFTQLKFRTVLLLS